MVKPGKGIHDKPHGGDGRSMDVDNQKVVHSVVVNISLSYFNHECR